MGDRDVGELSTSSVRTGWRLRICDRTGSAVRGAGILLSERLALTCAHVVGERDATLRVEFPEAPGTEPVGAGVAEHGWFPQDHGPHRRTPDGDLALLVLDAPRPEVRPATLRFAHPYTGRGVWMAGYTENAPGGLWVNAKVSGASGYWVQLDPANDGRTVLRGFSGAGVTDDSTEPRGSRGSGGGPEAGDDVLGMIVTRYSEALDNVPGGPRLRASHMLPVERITELLPQVAGYIKGIPSHRSSSSRTRSGPRPFTRGAETGAGRDVAADAGLAAELAEWLAPGAWPQPGVKLLDTTGDVRREAALSAALGRADLAVDAAGGPAGALVGNLVELLGLPAPYAKALRTWLCGGAGGLPPLPGTQTQGRETARDLVPGGRPWIPEIRTPGSGGPGGRPQRPRLPVTVVVHGLGRSTEPHESVDALGRLRCLDGRVLVVMGGGEGGASLRHRVTRDLLVPALSQCALELIDALADLEHENRHRPPDDPAARHPEVATQRAVELPKLPRDGDTPVRLAQRLEELNRRLREDLASLVGEGGSGGDEQGATA